MTEAGTYRVRVQVPGSRQSAFTISAAFLSFPAFQRPGDPDRRPASAKAVAVGTPLEDSLDPSKGDSWDWFVLKATAEGTRTVVTRQVGTDGTPDLVLEVSTDGKFSDAHDRSDHDLQGNGPCRSSPDRRYM